MARRTKREQKPPKSNRGRPDARGVFIMFDEVPRETTQHRTADEPLARDQSREDVRA